MKKIEIIVNGMMCANCKATVEHSLKKTKGVKNYSVNLANKKALVTFDEDVTSFDVIKENIENEGYEVFDLKELDAYQNKLEIKQAKDKKRLIIIGILTLIEFYASMGVMLGLPFFFVESNPTIYVIIQLCLVIPVVILSLGLFKKGYFNLFRFHPSMESLVSLGCSASFGYSIYSFIRFLLTHNHDYLHSLYFESVVVILFLIQLGKFIENKSLTKANNSIKELLQATPNTCKVLENNEVVIKDIKDVSINDIVVATIGDSIAFDGKVIEGNCSIDQSMLTGESLPVDKQVDSDIYAGTIINNGYIKYKITSIGEDMVINKIIKMVEEAQSSKAPIEKIADRVANVFTKVVLAIAILTFIIWIVVSKDLEKSITCAVSVLVIACPCSLGLATPTAIIVGSGVAARNGIFFKDAESLQNLGRIETFAFDKTGTLTTGNFIVKEINTDMNIDEFLEILSSSEQYSSHVLAKSILKYVKEKSLRINEISDYKEISGLGITCTYQNDHIEIGNISILNESLDEAKKKANNGYTIIGVRRNYQDIGFICLEDEIKENALEVVNYLHSKNHKVVLISGDNNYTTNNIANKLGIDEKYGNVLPDNKYQIVNALKETSKVAMIGDGINDSVALTAADVGISFASGTNIAVESSDIIIMNNKLEDIITASKISNKIMRHIKQNLFFAFFYNSIGILLATGLFYPIFGILLSPMIGALAMSFSSVSVVSNSLRINTFKKEK